MRSVLLLSLALPAPAWADCVYTGAKRAYLECIYDLALTAAADAADLLLDVAGLDTRATDAEAALASQSTRMDGLESFLVNLDEYTGNLSDRVDLMNDALITVGSTAAGLVPQVDDLQADLGDAQADIADLTAAVRKGFWRGEMTSGHATSMVNLSTATASFVELFHSGDTVTFLGASNELQFTQTGLATIDLSVGVKCYKPAGPQPAAYARTLIYRNGVRVLSTIGGDLENFWTSIEDHLMLEVAAGDRLRFDLQCNDGVFTSVDSGDRATLMAKWEPL